MPQPFSRRSFVGASMVATAAAALVSKPAGLIDWIAKPDAHDRVFAILQQHFGLQTNDRALSDAFVQALKADGTRHECRPPVGERLNSNQAEGESLELYILQAFVMATNYASYASGQGERLELTATKQLPMV